MWKTTWMRYRVGGHGERTNKEVMEVICSALGWPPRQSFKDGLAATVRWYLEQQGGYSGGRLWVLAATT